MNIDRDETLADLQATVDYVNSITEQSDSLEFELSSELLDALTRVAASVKAAQDLLTTNMLSRLEDGGPRVFGHERFERVRKYTERTDHEAVVAAVIADAEVCETPAAAARVAAKRMRDIYLSPSSTAKKGAVDKLSVPRDVVFSKEYTGYKVERVVLPDVEAS